MMIVLNIHDLLGNLERYFDEIITVSGFASFQYRRCIWLHDHANQNDAALRKIVLEPTRPSVVSYLMPLRTGKTTIDSPEPTAYRTLKVAGTLKRASDPTFAAALEDILWTEAEYDEERDAEGLSHGVRTIFRSVGATHPAFTDAVVSVSQVLNSPATFEGRPTTVSGVLLARAGEESSLLMEDIEHRDDLSRCIALTNKGVYRQARAQPAIPDVSRLDLYPNIVVNALVTGVLQRSATSDTPMEFVHGLRTCVSTSPRPRPRYYDCLSS